jgi:hypothetical protein
MTYSDDTGEYNVRDGDVWRAGQHAVICGSALDADIIILYSTFTADRPHIVYADLPFNQAHTTRFHHLADIPVPRHDDVIRAIVSLALLSEPAACYLEYAADASLLQRIITSWGYDEPVTVPGHYGSSERPCSYTCLGPIARPWIVSGASDKLAPQYVAAYHRLPVVDVCAGRGHTPVVAAKLGLSSCSVELVPRRAAIILQRLAKIDSVLPYLHHRRGDDA